MNAPMAIVLAAGKSTRMKSTLPKVVHEVCGRPMVDYVLDAARAAGCSKLVAVIGHQADAVQQMMSHHRDVSFARQTEQKGTGHAVMMCRDALKGHQGPVLILAGDTPLLKGESLKALIKAQQDEGAVAVIGSATTEANQGLGRIVRDAQGAFQRIVEEKDADAEQKKIQEINTGCYAFDGPSLLKALDEIKPNNSQGEYYLTDCPRVLMDAGKKALAVDCFSITEAMGVNTRVQLADITRTIQRETLERLMLAGVTIVSPEQTMIDPRAVIGQDTIIEPFTVIRGPARIGDNCRLGPHLVVEGDVTIPPGTTLAPFQVIR